MARKLQLTVVGSSATSSDPCDKAPKGLGKAGVELWRNITGEYDFSDGAGRVILAQICRAADRAHEAATIIARDGPLVRGRDGVWKEHPLLRVEASARSFIVRSLHRLGLDVEPIKPVGRPALGFGWKPDADE
jgi:P27 family predicted phage terminase small subunit